MKLKLMKISTKSFIIIFSIINVIAGFIVGTMITIMSLAAPDEQSMGPIGPWAILLFPVLNGLLGLVTGAFFTGLYNLLAKYLGGIELEFKNQE